MEMFLLLVVGFLAAVVFTIWSSMDRIDQYVGQATNELKKKIWELEAEVDSLEKKLDNMRTSNEENEDE